MTLTLHTSTLVNYPRYYKHCMCALGVATLYFSVELAKQHFCGTFLSMLLYYIYM